MDLDDATASDVLNNSIPAGKQRYGFHSVELYEFQPDNTGGWHGYPINGSKAPSSILKTLKSNGIINNSEYNRLMKGK